MGIVDNYLRQGQTALSNLALHFKYKKEIPLTIEIYNQWVKMTNFEKLNF